MDEANTDPVPSTIVEEVTVESTDPATAESATDCTDGQNKVSFRLEFVAMSRRSVMFVLSMATQHHYHREQSWIQMQAEDLRLLHYTNYACMH